MDHDNATGCVILEFVAGELTKEQVEAIAALRVASAEFADAEAEMERKRKALHAAIAAALRLRVAPSIVERETPYDRNHVGRIRREHKIPPTRPATVVSKRQALPSGGTVDDAATA